MKKPKRPFDLEEDPSEKSGYAPGALDEEDIILLDDIVELSDEDEVDQEVEILDVDSDLDFDAPDERSGRRMGAGPDADLLEEFSFDKEPSSMWDSTEAKTPSEADSPEASEESDKGAAGEEDEDFLADLSFLDEEDEVSEELLEDEGPAEDQEDLFAQLGLGEKSDPLVSVSREGALTDMGSAGAGPEVGLLGGAASVVGIEKESAAPVKDGPDSAAEAGRASEDGYQQKGGEGPVPSVEEFVSQIEGRLIEAVREIVEARLPEIVKAVLREEIERIRKEAR